MMASKKLEIRPKWENVAKRKLSKKAKDLLFKINNDLPRYESIDYLIKNLKNK